MAAKCAANPMGASNPVSARTQPGLSAAISVAVVTAISNLAKPAKIKSDRNDAAGAGACQSSLAVLAQSDQDVSMCGGEAEQWNVEGE